MVFLLLLLSLVHSATGSQFGLVQSTSIPIICLPVLVLWLFLLVVLLLALGHLQKSRAKISFENFEISFGKKSWIGYAVDSAEKPQVLLLTLIFFLYLYATQPTFQEDIYYLIKQQGVAIGLIMMVVFSLWTSILKYRRAPILLKLIKTISMLIAVSLNFIYFIFAIFSIMFGPTNLLYDTLVLTIAGETQAGSINIILNTMLLVLGYPIYVAIAILTMGGIKINRKKRHGLL